MAAAAPSRMDEAALMRLVARGLVMLAGVTPSDASHVVGGLDAWDGAAAAKALALFARKRNGAGARIAAGAQALAKAVIDQLTAQTVDCLLEAAFDEDGWAEGSDVLARHALVRAGLGRHRGVVELDARLGVPVIGLGASAPAYYGAVGARLGTRMILPAHAGVANAIGAVVGQVAMHATALVSSPGPGQFALHGAAGVVRFADRDAALVAAEAMLREQAAGLARAAGAVDLRFEVARDVREAMVEGQAMFIDATVRVTAHGRPRIAGG